MSDADLVRKAVAVNQANLALGHEVFVGDGATFVRNRKFPDVFDANHVTNITAASPEAIERLLARVGIEFAGYRHRVFHTDYRTPPECVARLVLDSYESNDALVMLLEGDLRASPRECDIRPMSDNAGRSAFAALRLLDWREGRARQGLEAGDAIGAEMTDSNIIKCPPIRYWLAYVDGQPRGYFSAWEGTEGVGQVENLFVEQEYRHRGLATALIARCVDDCRAQGAGPVVIVADPTDTPKTMYAAMGFRPVAVKRSYRREIS